MPFDQTPTTRTEDRVLERLVRGRNKIARGWCRHALFSRGQVCARGAIYPRVNTDGSVEQGEEWNDFLRAEDCLRAQVPEDWFGRRNAGHPGYSYCHVDYNNDPRTKKTDILALFDRAITAQRALTGKSS